MAEHPLRQLLADLRTDMDRNAAPGPTTLRRWRAVLERLDEALQMLFGHGPSSSLEMSSGVSARTGQGFVHLVWGEQRGQLTPEETRAHAQRLAEAAEAAEYDSIFVRWLLDNRVVEGIEQAMPLLLAFRAYRESPASASQTSQQPIAPEEPPEDATNA